MVSDLVVCPLIEKVIFNSVTCVAMVTASIAALIMSDILIFSNLENFDNIAERFMTKYGQST